MQRSERSETGMPHGLADFVDGVGFFCGYIAPTHFPEHAHPEVAVDDVCYENTSCLSTWQTAGGRQLTRLLGGGNVSILPGGQPHASEWLQVAEHVFSYLTPEFAEKAARNLLREEPVEIVEDRTAEDPMIRQLAESLRVELRRGHRPERLYVESLANVLAAHLLRNYSARRKPLPEPGESISRRRLGRVVDYVNDNLGKDLTLSELAEVAALSPRQFRRSTGLTPGALRTFHEAIVH